MKTGSRDKSHINKYAKKDISQMYKDFNISDDGYNDQHNRTELFGINMGFWVCLLVITIIVILMNVVFWSMKPLKTVEE